MAKVTIKAGEVNTITPTSASDSYNIFSTSNVQIAANKGDSGSLTFQARSAGSKAFEDILDSTGAVIGTIDFSAPVTLRITDTKLSALQCDASSLSSDVVIEIVDSIRRYAVISNKVVSDFHV